MKKMRRRNQTKSFDMNTKPIQVLMVEDVESDAQLQVVELRRGGYDVTFERVDTSATMLTALHQKAWDIILCDFTMPGFSGETARQLAQTVDTDRPFIYVSGTLGEEVAVEALKSGAHDYVLKNNLKRLVPAVDRALREARLRREHRLLEAERDQLVKSLSAALMDVKRLSGLLPICSVCKKIRNDRKEWQLLEIFIRENSEAQFTHSLCPDCLTRLHDAGGKSKN